MLNAIKERKLEEYINSVSDKKLLLAECDSEEIVEYMKKLREKKIEEIIEYANEIISDIKEIKYPIKTLEDINVTYNLLQNMTRYRNDYKFMSVFFAFQYLKSEDWDLMKILKKYIA